MGRQQGFYFPSLRCVSATTDPHVLRRAQPVEIHCQAQQFTNNSHHVQLNLGWGGGDGDQTTCLVFPALSLMVALRMADLFLLVPLNFFLSARRTDNSSVTYVWK